MPWLFFLIVDRARSSRLFVQGDRIQSFLEAKRLIDSLHLKSVLSDKLICSGHDKLAECLEAIDIYIAIVVFFDKYFITVLLGGYLCLDIDLVRLYQSTVKHLVHLIEVPL